MINLTLYGTSGCHLCDEAQVLLNTIKNQFLFTLEMVDIADDESLVKTYGIKIPVLIHSNKSELSWPFNENVLTAWLKSNS